MGTKWASGFESVLIGSNTYAAFTDAEITVLAIPAYSKTN